MERLICEKCTIFQAARANAALMTNEGAGNFIVNHQCIDGCSGQGILITDVLFAPNEEGLGWRIDVVSTAQPDDCPNRIPSKK